MSHQPPGEKVDYYVGDKWKAASTIANDLVSQIYRGELKADDIFVLAPSISKATKSKKESPSPTGRKVKSVGDSPLKVGKPLFSICSVWNSTHILKYVFYHTVLYICRPLRIYWRRKIFPSTYLLETTVKNLMAIWQPRRSCSLHFTNRKGWKGKLWWSSNFPQTTSNTMERTMTPLFVR